MSSIPQSEELQQLTPMLRQYYELKSRAHDAILFFRMGDFYEVFGSDAELVSPILDIVLTSREKGDKSRIPFCGVPHHSAKAYWIKLLKLGFRVAIADQIEDAALAKGLVKRDIVQIMTPGCIDDPEALEADRPNYLLAFYEEPKTLKCALMIVDISTGELRLGNVKREDLDTWVEVLGPREILARKFMHEELVPLTKRAQSQPSLAVLSEAALRDSVANDLWLKQSFAVEKLIQLPCGAVEGGRELLASAFQYLGSLKANTSQFLTVLPLQDSDRMLLDDTVLRDLELFETMRRRETEGSLYREINLTKTPMGARLLRYDLSRPFVQKNPIAERLDAVGALLSQPVEWMEALQCELRSCGDLERLMTRIVSGKAQPLDLAGVRQGLKTGLWLEIYLSAVPLDSPLLAKLSADLKAAVEPFEILNQILADNPEALGSLKVFRTGYNADLDKFSALSQDGEAEIERYEKKLRAETGISSLKIREHKTYGLLIEVTKSNLAKVPTSFKRRQTMVNNERFSTFELEDLSQSLSSAMDEALAQEHQLFQALLEQLAPFQQLIKDFSARIAMVDLLQSLASKARKDRYCRPQQAKKGELSLKGCRHPVVERWVGQHAFMPNDLDLSTHKQMVITGPNMAGKSTVMRQTALAAILHQMGSYVPAHEATLPLFDRVFTRVGAADDLSRGQSTFMVEMSESASILRQASERSLVILDEVGRGTSTQDGLAIASAILGYIAQNIRCYTLFATHYHELVDISRDMPSVQLAQVEVLESEQGIRFTHKLRAGAASRSFGIEVAKLAGIPDAVIDGAKRFLNAPGPQVSGDSGSEKIQDKARSQARKPPLELSFMPSTEQSFDLKQGAVRNILERLERLNVLKTTPLQALNVLDELKTYLDQKEQVTLFPEGPHLC